MKSTAFGAILLGASLISAAVAQDGSGLRATLTARLAPEAGQVAVQLTLHNRSGRDLPLTLPHAGKQSCATAPHVRVLRVSTREVVYPVGNEMIAVTCPAEPAKFHLVSGGSLVFDRTLQLNPGRYVVEAYVPASAETMRSVSAGYVTVTVP